MSYLDIATGTPALLASIDNGVLVITLNRPEARNAMTTPMVMALVQVLADAEVNPHVKSIVLTGAGKGFCAGGDVKAMAEDGEGGGGTPSLDYMIHLQRLAQRGTAGKLFKIPKPTIAMINGAAAGAGLALALACDLRVMSSAAVMITSFAKVGLPGDFGGTYFMSKLIGAAKARELYLLSNRVGADEALRLGLTNRVVEPDVLQAETMELAVRLAAGPSVAFRYMKENLNRAMSGEIDDCLDLEATHHVHCLATADHREAAQAFVERREPVFVGS